MTTTEVPVIEREIVLDMMRDQREDDAGFTGLFVIGVRGEGVTIAPCVEAIAITAIMLKGIFQAKHEDVEWIAMAVDSFRWTAPEPPPEGSDFDAMFRAGDDRITEAVFAAAVDKDGPVWGAQQVYIAGPGGIVWDEIEEAQSPWLIERLMAMFP